MMETLGFQNCNGMANLLNQETNLFGSTAFMTENRGKEACEKGNSVVMVV